MSSGEDDAIDSTKVGVPVFQELTVMPAMSFFGNSKVAIQFKVLLI